MHPKIVLVDDDYTQRMLMEMFLHGEGYEQVELFASPAEALDYARTIWIDLLITDYHMREYTGVQLIRRISKYRPDLPAIIVTGSDLALAESANVAVVRKSCLDFRRRLLTQVNRQLKKSGCSQPAAHRNLCEIETTVSPGVFR